ncbi:MAG: threonylcarbamoyl-AMP synthase [Candidatus Omnitrophica bacterium]|nr:threonylcarbamoyl-AMP synthase [Candidatus Omnitrophota bacterium]
MVPISSKDKILNAGDPANMAKAVSILRGEGVVAFPTETVYGLGADVFSAKAIGRVFEVKKRPSFDPLIVHVSSLEEAQGLWKEVPPVALDLMKRFWPGPLTLVLPKTDEVPDLVTSGLPTVAVRLPDSPIALELIRGLGHPIAAPSANIFGYTSPTTASAVWEDLGDHVDLVLDGGPARVGVESTILKVEKNRCILLRPGGVPLETIEACAPVVRKKEGAGVCEAPGSLQAHYAPWTALALLDKPFGDFAKDLGEIFRTYEQKEIPWPRAGLLAFDAKGDMPWFESVEVLSESGNLHEAAHRLFGAIRKLDRMHLDLILAERAPDEGLGMAINDRLGKASGGRSGTRFLLDRLKQEGT